MIETGLNIQPDRKSFGFHYGEDSFGPSPEIRTLDSIRKSLKDPDCKGPEKVYSIVMDVGKEKHRRVLNELHLLFGIVTYAEGTLGQEPVRSQGHMHKKSKYANGWSTPEVYEIWEGSAIIYMQEYAKDDPGRCFAVKGNPGDIIIVPPGWAHATVSADPTHPLTFGAWCDREYGFEYDDIRKRKGLAYYPLLKENQEIEWLPNENYRQNPLHVKIPRKYKEFGLDNPNPIYRQFEENQNKFSFVPRPDRFADLWNEFVP